MRNFVDEIVLALLCCLFSLLASKSEIASTLFLSEGTVRNHISSILSKKALSNRTQIAVLYYRG